MTKEPGKYWKNGEGKNEKNDPKTPRLNSMNIIIASNLEIDLLTRLRHACIINYVIKRDNSSNL